MRAIRQLLRQPLKTLTGVLLIAAAVAVLCVGVGQGYASIRTQRNFEKMFTRLFHGGEARLVLLENAEDPLECGIDIILVGDSLGMAVLGYRDTLQVTLEQSLHHCAAVRRGAPDAFVVPSVITGTSLVSANANRLAVDKIIRILKISANVFFIVLSPFLFLFC